MDFCKSTGNFTGSAVLLDIQLSQHGCQLCKVQHMQASVSGIQDVEQPSPGTLQKSRIC